MLWQGKNKLIIIGAVLLAVFLIVGLAYGYNKKSKEARIKSDKAAAEVQSKLDEQHAKIEELQGFKSEQQQKDIEEANESTKNQAIDACQEKKEDCEKTISTLNKDKDAEIKGWQKKIDAWEKNLKEYISKTNRKVIEDNIKDSEREIERLKQAKISDAAEKNNLLAGECKDYQNPCE